MITEMYLETALSLKDLQFLLRYATAYTFSRDAKMSESRSEKKNK